MTAWDKISEKLVKMSWEYKSYSDCYYEMNQEQVVPKYSMVQEDSIVSKIEETSGSDVVPY